MPRPDATPLWFDAHLDLACMAVCGRDLTLPLDRCGGTNAPPAVCLPSLREGGVRFALATIFLEAGGAGPEGYPAGDADRAFLGARAQLEVYLTWRDQGLVSIDLPRALAVDPEVGEIRGGMGVAEVVPPDVLRRARSLASDGALHIGILLEGADPIRDPDHASWWAERGVCAVGLAWWKPSRYAGGNGSAHGLTDLGRALVPALDHLRIVHDLSHLSDASADELLALTDRPVIASHSNCRALLPPMPDGAPNQRHLREEHIHEIVRRGGVIGLNLYATFLCPAPDAEATIEHALAHVERICDIAGSRAHIGLGSDMDGGFSAERLPRGIRAPRDLERLCDALRGRGWSDADLDGIRCGNWLRFWRAWASPATGFTPERSPRTPGGTGAV